MFNIVFFSKMKNTLKTITTATVLGATFLAVPTAFADDVSGGLQAGVNAAGSANGLAKGSVTGSGGYVSIIVNFLLVAIGIVSVIMIIIGGFRYTLSNGDENAVRAAKDTILYSVIGLIVAILSFVIVNFVLGIFKV